MCVATDDHAADQGAEASVGVPRASMPHAWHRPHPQAWRRTLIVLAYLLVLPGCGGAPPLPVLLRMPALQLAPVGTPPVSDGRSRFRGIFCEVFAHTHGREERARCQEHLWQLADEPSVEASSPVPQHAPHLHLVIVPGAFEECISATARPYRGGSERLRALGYRVEAVPVSGRSGSDHNARLIAEALSGMPAVEGERLILVGYSKGVVDILHFLVNHPAQALRVSGVLSVAGAVNGSPLADMAALSYALSAAYVPLPQCATGDRRVLEDLRPAVRLRWLATHRLPAHIKYFSLVAFTERSRMARALSLPAGLLESSDPRNDGQVLASDAIIPGSTLLGYANADHWAVAIAIEDQIPFITERPGVKEPFPADVLFEAMVLFVAETLSEP